MKSEGGGIDKISKLLDLKLKSMKSDLVDLKTGFKSVIRTQASHTTILEAHSRVLVTHSKSLKKIIQTQEAHTESLADIESRIIPLAEVVGEVVIDHSKRIGKAEGRIDDLERVN